MLELIKISNFFNKVTNPIPATEYQPIIGTGYSYIQLNLFDQTHAIFPWLIQSTFPGKGFIANSYEFDGNDCNGYNLTTNINDTLGISIGLGLGGVIDSTGAKILTLCDGALPRTLDAGYYFNKFSWSTGDTTQTILVDKEGTYPE